MSSVTNSPVHSRILYFDLLRIMACAMIVIMHSQRAGMDIPGWFLSSTSYLTTPGIGLFFMISGALILGKASRLGTAAELEVFPFLRHRLLKVAVPLAFWTLSFLDKTHDIPYMLSCALITFILAALLTWLIGKVPGGKWVIGG